MSPIVDGSEERSSSRPRPGPKGLVDVGAKPVVQRRATATGFLRLSARTLDALRAGTVPKGDPFPAAEVAALLAAKDTPRLLPHCHPIPLSAVDVDLALEEAGVRATVTVKAEWRTGVEMEALTATTTALLVVWDMVKPVEKDAAGQYPEAAITDVRVVVKEKAESSLTGASAEVDEDKPRRNEAGA